MLIPWVYFLKEDEQLVVESFTHRQSFNGPGAVPVLMPHRAIRRKGTTLGPTDYLRVKDTLTGQMRNEVGPKLFFPVAQEQIVDHLKAIPLKKNQYVRVIDKNTGVVRVERGEGSVYLSPTEEMIDEVKEGINIDDKTAVLVRDIVSGQLELVTTPQVFVPTPNQTIVQVRQKIRLATHEVVVIKDKSGKYVFRRGTDPESAFFLDPYSELVEFTWSSGLHKEARALKITYFDLRPKFMWYEFEVRTQDNVELILGITFFWEVFDIEAMLRKTDDTPGDVCSHARSMIIQAVSQASLEKFLDSFNAIVRSAVVLTEDSFYAERGVRIEAVEVRSITCKEPATQQILQEIIQETTNRLNQLMKQESENEISLKRIQGQIESEQAKGNLLSVQREHAQTEGRMMGESEAERVRAFLEGLTEAIPLSEKIALFNVLRKQDALESLSQGTAQLFFTPSDVNLSIKTE